MSGRFCRELSPLLFLLLQEGKGPILDLVLGKGGNAWDESEIHDLFVDYTGNLTVSPRTKPSQKENEGPFNTPIAEVPVKKRRFHSKASIHPLSSNPSINQTAKKRNELGPFKY
jgi:hypothetical protein